MCIAFAVGNHSHAQDSYCRHNCRTEVIVITVSAPSTCLVYGFWATSVRHSCCSWPSCSCSQDRSQNTISAGTAQWRSVFMKRPFHPGNFMQYRDERDLDTVMNLIDNELSEPYSIFTYRCCSILAVSMSTHPRTA